MTDKQIIIDGVDVSRCEFFRVLRPCGCLGRYRCNCDSISTESLNCEENNCIYKQLKRKEQECERLKEILKDKTDKYNKLAVNYDAYVSMANEQLDQLKTEVKSKTEYIQEQREIIDQYSKEIEMYKKCQGKRASKREEELKAENKNLKAKLTEWLDKKGITRTEKEILEQCIKTLTEIKEIAQYDVYTPHTDLCIKLNWVKKKIRECEVE